MVQNKALSSRKFPMAGPWLARTWLLKILDSMKMHHRLRVDLLQRMWVPITSHLNTPRSCLTIHPALCSIRSQPARSNARSHDPILRSSDGNWQTSHLSKCDWQSAQERHHQDQRRSSGPYCPIGHRDLFENSKVPARFSSRSRPAGWYPYHRISWGSWNDRYENLVLVIDDTSCLIPTIGMTAYGSLHEIGQPKKGDVILISAAAGAVGQTVGQIAVRQGVHVRLTSMHILVFPFIPSSFIHKR